MAFEVPPLPYDYNALEPYIDTQTMQLHHDKHHGACVNKLNNALQNQWQLASWPVQDLVRRINEVPHSLRTAVPHNAGGHVTPRMFWQIMNPNGRREPPGEL